MQQLLDEIRSLCVGLPPQLLDRHIRRLPPAYFERYTAADVSRHLRLIDGLRPGEPVAVEVGSLAAQDFEVLVVGESQSGTVACITAALAVDGFDLEDLHLNTYDDEPPDDGPGYFVVQLRISGSLHGRSVAELTNSLHERLRVAFAYLGQNRFRDAQAAAAETPGAPESGVPLTPADHVGLVLGNDFRLTRKLASGGMGEVYLATQLSLSRTVAVKLSKRAGAADSDQLLRFAREATTQSQFNCPHIVPVLAAGTAPARGGLAGWIAMEYLAGGDLARWLQRQGPPPAELGVRWFRQALEGLRYAHRHAVLHRDLKPHNLLLTVEGDVKVGDFGLFLASDGSEPDVAAGAPVVGTPHYMAPEQAAGEPLDERSDIFSMGTTFFHLFSGRLPFDAAGPAALMAQVAKADAPRLTEVAPNLPVALSVVIGRMMARQREERYQDVGVILEDLASYESRRLLRSAESGTFAPVAVAAEAERAGDETQAYVPAMVDGSRAG
jgi:hypothetical protein